jgi:predicted TIM-barrel fold metal-dependent hydrolase
MTSLSISAYLLTGCTYLVKPVAGDFSGDPLEISSEVSSEAMKLIRQAFTGFEETQIVDAHVHVIGLGAGETGAWVNPDMREGYDWAKRLKFAVYKNASGITNEEQADQEYIDRLVKLIDGMQLLSEQTPDMRFLILAFDRHYENNGDVNHSMSPFYVPNDYVVSLAERYPQYFIPVISINPYRDDALKALERWHDRGVRFLKWLPNSQGIDPSDKNIIPFYKKLAEYDMVLITHTGREDAVEGEAYQHYGNPQLLHLPLRAGVKVVMSHFATHGMCDDIDAGGREASCFQLAVEMMEDERYEEQLFADISTITQYNHADKLAEILDMQSLHHRFINGSDYPLPAINILYRTSQLYDMGFITEEEKEMLDEIYSYNPLLFDFVLKRTIKNPHNGNRLRKEVFVIPDPVRDTMY